MTRSWTANALRIFSQQPDLSVMDVAALDLFINACCYLCLKQTNTESHQCPSPTNKLSGLLSYFPPLCEADWWPIVCLTWVPSSVTVAVRLIDCLHISFAGRICCVIIALRFSISANSSSVNTGLQVGCVWLIKNKHITAGEWWNIANVAAPHLRARVWILDSHVTVPWHKLKRTVVHLLSCCPCSYMYFWALLINSTV